MIRAFRIFLCLSLLGSSTCFATDTSHTDNFTDSDYDQIPDAVESRIGTDPWLSDTDGDGLSDGAEVGPDYTSPLDSDQDRRINALDVDDDNDGIPTVIEAKQDSDGDGIADYLDSDTDGDGKSDREEAGLSGKDSDQDGIDDFFDVDQTNSPDTNGDGIDGHQFLQDKDRDGIPDIRDALDQDGEAGDLDNDGLNNSEEAMAGSDPENPDSDGDGVTDAIELGTTLGKPLDTDSDGQPNILDTDDDNDGLLTRHEVYIKGTHPQDTDTDQDGKPDYIDTDDDNDGIPTRREDQNRDGNPANDDTDKDGTPDYLDKLDNTDSTTDDDGDGISNQQEKSLGSNPDGRDTDGDGLEDALEIGFDPSAPTDTDNDGIFDFLDPDDDGDGIPSLIEGEADRDGDGRVNYLDVDPSGYFYCANSGKIVEGISNLRIEPEQYADIIEDGSEGVFRWEASQPGSYSLQFDLPEGMKSLDNLNQGLLYVTPYNGKLVSLGRSEDIGNKGYLARFKPKDLPVWYSGFTLQKDAPPVVNLNIPLTGGVCGEA